VDTNFVDYVRICCRSGKGGKGSTHLHRDKLTAFGGPDGGDGGRGGHIILRGNKQFWTLIHLKYRKHIIAKQGGDGGASHKSGKEGDDEFNDNLAEEMNEGELTELSGDLIDSIETGIRYSALYSLFMIPLTISALALARKNRFLHTISDVMLLLPFWWIAKYIVIDNAITDNLTELLQAHGLIFLALLIVVFAIHVSFMANIIQRTRARYFLPLSLLCLLTLALLPVTWWLLNQGIESLIVKDGKIFSGVQFILGENRSDLLPEIALFGRWCAFYAGAVTVTASGMYCAMRLWPVGTVPGQKPRTKSILSRSRPTAEK